MLRPLPAKTIVLCLMMLAPVQLFGQTASPQIPAEVRAMLDRKYNGWQLFRTPPEVLKWFREDGSPVPQKVVKGDFDGNKKADYALLIQHGKETTKDDNGEFHDRRLIAVFFKQPRGYLMRILEDAGDGLETTRKGDSIYDYEKGRNVRVANDTIGSYIYAKIGWVFLYRKGKFRRILTSD